MAVVGALPAQYLGRGPGPRYIEIATTVERHRIQNWRDPSQANHHCKNTTDEAVLPLVLFIISP